MSRNALLVLLLVGPALPAWGDCPLELRSYEDLDGRQMVLEFDPPASDRGVSVLAVASLRHPKRGEIARFDVVSRPGYGDVLLVADERDHSAYFFTANLKSTKTAEGSRLLFVEGLGLTEWQEGELPGSRDNPVGDVLWRLVGCQE